MRQQPALDQQLPDHRAPSAAERHARRDLARAGAGAREQQPRDIDARDEQHQADRAPQHQQRLADVRRSRCCCSGTSEHVTRDVVLEAARVAQTAGAPSWLTSALA